MDAKLPGCVLFDLDGTLAHTLPDIAEAVRQTVCRQRPPPDDTVATWIGHGVQRLVERALAGKIDAPEDPPGLEAALDAFGTFYAAHACEQSAPFPGALTLLRQLRDSGRKTGCVTNKGRYFTIPMLEAFELATLLDVVVCGDDLPQRKPDPAPLFHALDLLGEKDSVYIGDSRADFDAAANAKIPFIGVSFGYDHAAPLSQIPGIHLLDSFADLARLL